MLREVEKLFAQGVPEQALTKLEEYCATHGNDARGCFLLAACRHQSGQLEAALVAFERALALAPCDVSVRSGKAAVLSDLGRHAEALQVYRRALLLAAADERPQLLVNMGVVMERLGDDRGALERYDQALGLAPDFAGALLNRGALFIRAKELEQALRNNLRLVEAHPDWEPAQYNLGEAWLTLGKWEEALAAYQRALTLEPASAKTLFAQCLALSMLRRFEEAQHALDCAKSVDTEAVSQCMRNAVGISEGEVQGIAPKVIYLLKEMQRMQDCDWKGWDALVADFEHLVASSLGQGDEIGERALVFHSLALPISAETRMNLHKSVAKQIDELVAGQLSGLAWRNRCDGKLRVGYLSPDFKVHPIGRLTRRLYALHDRSRFEVYGYALTGDAGDEVRRDIKQSCDVFRELDTMNDADAAKAIHADGIDILIDLAGYTTNARSEILALRPSPVQVSFLGFPGSMGASFIHYFVTDRICTPPELENQFTEKLAYLPDTCMIYNNREEIARHPVSRADFGLPEKSFVFCCFNNSYKIDPVIFDVWMRVLKRSPNSVLWLFGREHSVIMHLRNEAEQRGISGSRLIFASFLPGIDQHLARYRLADVFLDTRTFNAVTTSADALWGGLPVLTCPGSTFISRCASSVVRAVGMDEMVVENLAQYEELACYLAAHPEEVARLKALLDKNRLTSPLFDTERLVRNLEAAYQTMWLRHEAGQEPATFQV